MRSCVYITLAAYTAHIRSLRALWWASGVSIVLSDFPSGRASFQQKLNSNHVLLGMNSVHYTPANNDPMGQRGCNPLWTHWVAPLNPLSSPIEGTDVLLALAHRNLLDAPSPATRCPAEVSDCGHPIMTQLSLTPDPVTSLEGQCLDRWNQWGSSRHWQDGKGKRGKEWTHTAESSVLADTVLGIYFKGKLSIQVKHTWKLYRL